MVFFKNAHSKNYVRIHDLGILTCCDKNLTRFVELRVRGDVFLPPGTKYHFPIPLPSPHLPSPPPWPIMVTLSQGTCHTDFSKDFTVVTFVAAPSWLLSFWAFYDLYCPEFLWLCNNAEPLPVAMCSRFQIPWRNRENVGFWCTCKPQESNLNDIDTRS